MSDRSDYIRCVSGPLEEKLRARIADLERRLRAAEGALAEIARLDTDLRADFSVGARQSQIARSALPHPVGEGT